MRKKLWTVMVCLGLILGLVAVSQAGRYKKETICQAQEALKTLGYYQGEITGTLDASTTEAIKAFQKEKGLIVDGMPGPKTRKALKAALEEKKAKEAQPTEEQPTAQPESTEKPTEKAE